MVPFSSEIDAHIDIERSKGVIGRELFFLVIVRVDDGTCSHIPLGIVPDNAEATDTIQVEVLETKVFETKTIMFRIRLRLVVGDTDRCRSIEELCSTPGTCKGC